MVVSALVLQISFSAPNKYSTRVRKIISLRVVEMRAFNGDRRLVAEARVA